MKQGAANSPIARSAHRSCRFNSHGGRVGPSPEQHGLNACNNMRKARLHVSRNRMAADNP